MKQKDFLIILILLFIVVVTWIGSSIHHNSVNSTISETINQQIFPIEPKFDLKIIGKLKTRKTINPSFELETITPTPLSTLPTQITSPKNSSGGGKLVQ